MSKTITHETTMIVEECVNCGLLFALPDDYRKRRLQDHAVFYCPAGHGQHFTAKSDVEKLREELATEKHLKRLSEESERRARQDSEHFKASRNALKGQITKIKKRVGQGMCPCCNRFFSDLHRHMGSKHPDFKNE